MQTANATFILTNELLDTILELFYEGYGPKEIQQMLNLPISYQRISAIIRDNF